MSPDKRSDEADWLGHLRLLRALGLRRQPASPALQPVRSHHFLDHADGETLLEPTELAPVSSPLVHRAVLVGQADVLCILLNCPLEEALAALAGAHAVVLAGRVVAAHGAQQRTLAAALLVIRRT